VRCSKLAATCARRAPPQCVTTYKNLAAMDGLPDRMEAIQEKLIGNQEARGKMRT
jgi:hypothetical protein